jgi:hypothetical protein
VRRQVLAFLFVDFPFSTKAGCFGLPWCSPGAKQRGQRHQDRHVRRPWRHYRCPWSLDIHQDEQSKEGFTRRARAEEHQEGGDRGDGTERQERLREAVRRCGANRMDNGTDTAGQNALIKMLGMAMGRRYTFLMC